VDVRGPHVERPGDQHIDQPHDGRFLSQSPKVLEVILEGIGADQTPILVSGEGFGLACRRPVETVDGRANLFALAEVEADLHAGEVTAEDVPERQVQRVVHHHPDSPAFDVDGQHGVLAEKKQRHPLEEYRLLGIVLPLQHGQVEVIGEHEENSSLVGEPDALERIHEGQAFKKTGGMQAFHLLIHQPQFFLKAG